jgi:hypothetical protein
VLAPEPPASGSPAATPSAPATTAPGATAAPATAQAALQTLIRERRGVPNGTAIFLKAARIHAAEPDLLILEVPPGPGLERLTDPTARVLLEKALGEELGARIRLEIRAPGTAGGSGESARMQRLTPERVKSGQLARFVREEPLLGLAVEEWDLELLD